MMFQSWFCRGNVVQYVAAISGALSIASYGMNSTWMSPFLPYLLSESSIIPMNSDEAAWCAIAPLIGCIFGALIGANLTDRIGRKYTILIMAPVVFICQIGIGYATDVWYLFALRMTIGVTDGACLTAMPMYVGEIASPDKRGFLSSLVCLFFLCGALLINTLGSFFSIWTCSIVGACIPAVHFIGFIFMPESPHFYIKVKEYQKAERSLRIFRGDSNVAKELRCSKIQCDFKKRFPQFT
ncbi:facilitated trehalose transporter Tret1 [Leptinotarsa decemlineata]|uniref:facilitated trehalose transporter Tret1 n=1 Tax=Leptinotarsa decemlineata TaxID=7539 RepID=UPI003D306B40